MLFMVLEHLTIKASCTEFVLSAIAIGSNVACKAVLLFASNLNGSNPIAFHLLLFGSPGPKELVSSFTYETNSGVLFYQASIPYILNPC